MKRVQSILLLVMFVLTLSACNELIVQTDDFKIEVHSELPHWEDHVLMEGAKEKVLDSLQFDASSFDKDIVGTYAIPYTYKNGEGELSVSVVDTTKPLVVLNGDIEMTIGLGTEYEEPGYSLSDNYDTEFSNVTVNSDMNTTLLGDYTVSYQVVDSSTNSSDLVIRTVHVVDKDVPIISLLGEEIMTLEVHTVFEEPGSSVVDNVDDNLMVIESGSVDFDTVGTYYMTYNTADTAGNVAIEKTRTIHIVDTTKPLIQLAGTSQLVITLDTEYIDPSVVVSDNYDLEEDITIVCNDLVTDTIGEYTIEYKAVDRNGNESDTISRTITVVEYEIASIVLYGLEYITLEFGEIYEDANAMMYSRSAVTLVHADNEIDYTVLGEQTLTYEMTVGEMTYSVSRIINIVDTVNPVVSLQDDADLTIEVLNAYVEYGVNCSDNFDAYLDAVITGTVDTDVLGDYEITYTVTDSSNNEVVLKRTVHVVDTTAPVVDLVGEESVFIEVYSSYIELGITSIDNFDTETIKSTEGSIDTSVTSIYTITYTVTDHSGNETIVTRMVHVEDTTAPVVVLMGSETLAVEVYSDYIDLGIFSVDNYDTDLDILFESTVDTAIVGEYIVTYTVTDNDANQTIKTRKILVVDSTSPEVVLNGDEVIYLEVYHPYIEQNATYSDNYDTDLTVVIDQHVNNMVLGEYTVTYSFTDDYSNQTVVTRTVHVVDTIVPVVTLIGNKVIYMNVFEDYVEENVISGDNYDTDLDVVINNTINTSILGEYIVTYTVKDDSLNETIITRTVHVEDHINPICTLVGEEEFTIQLGTYYELELADCSDNYDTELDLIILGDLDISALGTTVMTYYTVDSSGNTSNVVSKTIHVVEHVETFDTDNYIKGLTGVRYPKDCVELDNGNILIMGSTYSDGIVVQLDAYGKEINRFPVFEHEGASILIYDMSVDSQDNILITGRNHYYEDGTYEPFIHKYSIDGTFLSEYIGPRVNGNEYSLVQEFSDGNYYVVSVEDGVRTSILTLDKDLTLLNTSEVLAYKIYASSLMEQFDGSYLLFGYKGSYSGNSVMITFDDEGNYISTLSAGWGLWLEQVNGISNTKILTLSSYHAGVIVYDDGVRKNTELTYLDYNVQVRRIVEIENGNYVVAGTIVRTVSSKQEYEGILFELDADLNIVNTRIISGLNNEHFYEMIILENGDLLILGETMSTDGDYKYIDMGGESSILTYMRIDAAFNTVLLDTVPPVITLNGDNVVNIIQGDEYTDLGVTVTDEVDPSPILVVYNDTIDTSELGKHFVYYIATDSSGNQMIAKRTIFVRSSDDTSSPNLIDLDDLEVRNEGLYMGLDDFDSDDNGYLSEEEILAVTRVSAFNTTITSLDLLTDFPNLTSLYFYNTTITDISVLSELTNLDNLNLSKNYISDLTPLAGLTNLRILDLGENQIADISCLSNLIHLESLDLGSNEINDVTALSVLTDLDYLNLELSNNIDLTPLSGLSSLTSLNLNYTRVSNPDILETITTLESLNVNGTGIVNIDFLSELPLIEEIYFGNNAVTDLTILSTLEYLTYVNADYLGSIDISPLKEIETLETLWIRNNNTTDEQILIIESLKAEGVSVYGSSY
jgi:hypothetical protein